MKVNKLIAIWIMAIVIVFDQATKCLVRINMQLHDSIPILGDLLRLTYVENDGAAFSISLPNPIYNRFFFVSTAIIAIVMIVYLLTKAVNRVQVWAFGLVLGGAIGNNLIDRLFFGKVTDFLDADFPDFIMQRWPIFNVADSAIVIAMGLILFDMFFLSKGNAIGEQDSEKSIELPVETGKE